MFRRAIRIVSDRLRRRDWQQDDTAGQLRGDLETNLPGLLEPPSPNDIRQGYRLVLGREPESEKVVEEQMRHASVSAFRLAALRSIEFRGKYRAICAERRDPYWSRSRRTLVFVHLEKTGGTTLRDLLAPRFEEDRICPGPNNPIYSFPVAELGHYDFFAGHFDLDSVRYIPRKNLVKISLFREPRARLLSWYRFHKSHPPHGEHAANPLVLLANRLSAEEFFELPEVRTNPLAHNRYLMAFGRSFSWYEQQRDSLSTAELDSALHDAKNAIRSLTALGITERFDLSVRYIYKTLDLSPPDVIKSMNVTDHMPQTLAGFRRVDPIHVTPRLAKALDEITVYDQAIYQFAFSEFARRCAESGMSERILGATVD
jgi:hypothetical protein